MLLALIVENLHAPEKNPYLKIHELRRDKRGIKGRLTEVQKLSRHRDLMSQTERKSKRQQQ
jgi:hypothetical protein